MRHDRWGIRVMKAGLLIGVIGLVGEGVFERKLLAAPFLTPESVPGRSKIYEHFIVQHVAFPVIGTLLVFAPDRLIKLVQSRLAMGLLAANAIAVTAVEVNTSRTDMFRPYPWLRSGLLERIQLVRIGGRSVNVLQLTHLLFSHGVLMGSIVAMAVAGRPVLTRFAGPRTSGRLAEGSPDRSGCR